MKKKILLSAFLSIALCLSIITGATFALFTSQSKVNVAVTSGKVSVLSSITDLEIYSMNEKQNDIYFENGGTATIDENTLTLDRITPGDKVTFNINIDNASNVTVLYQTLIQVLSDNGLFEALDVRFNNEEYNGVTSITDWATLDPSEEGTIDIVVPVSLELPVEANNDYQDKTSMIAFTVNAIQGNADVENISASDNVYEAFTAYDLTQYAKIVEANGNATIKLMNDIDLKDVKWDPIDTKGNVVLDGNGYTISNMTVNKEGGYAGFFGYAYSGKLTVKNVTFENSYVSSTGSFVGTVLGGAYYASVTMENVVVEVSTVLSTANYGIRVGGLIGSKHLFDGGERPSSEGLSLTNCSVNNSTVTGYHNVGGFMGSILYGSARTNDNIVGCSVTNVTAYYKATNENAASAMANDAYNTLTDDDFVATNFTKTHLV